MHNLGRTGASSQHAVLETLCSRPYWLLIQFIPRLPFGLQYTGFRSSTLNAPDSYHSAGWMSLHMMPHCSPHWPTLHVPVNEFNGLRSDSHELLPVMLGAGCSPWAHRGTTDTGCGFSSPKFTQKLTLRSLSLSLSFFFWSYFPLCALFCLPLARFLFSHCGIFLPDKGKKEKKKTKVSSSLHT